MLSIKEAAATLTTLEPTVRFDLETDTIVLTVIATPKPEEPGWFNVLAAPVSVPIGTWNMVWHLESSDEFRKAEYGKVELAEHPLPNVHISGSEMKSPTQWQAVIDNQVTSFNGFNYLIEVRPAGQLQPMTRHDPTIAVTNDPITG